MKARLIPLYFKGKKNSEFDEQLSRIKKLLENEADFLEPVECGTPIPEADAIVFPKLVRDAFKEVETIKKINLPIIILTSLFGTIEMWDWEIATYYKSKGIKVFTPYNLELSKTICRALALKRDIGQTKFLVFQDNPGEGVEGVSTMEGFIFKRFYWFEDECAQLMKDKFGVEIIKRSFRKLGEDARNISDNLVEEVSRNWKFSVDGVSSKALKSAIRMYIAVKREIGDDDCIKGIGINCLNESFFTDTTPCLAWTMLFEEKGIIWACEADIMSLITKYIINKSLNASVMMSNLYPFLMGETALEHERMERYPVVDEPQNHILVAHCGYFGLIPRPLAEKWVLRPRALAMVDENAIAVDAYYPVGDITLTKLHPSMSRIQAIDGKLVCYANFPGTDCRTGAVIKVKDGYDVMNSLYSHHSILVSGRKSPEIEMVAKVFDLEFEKL